MSLTLRQSVQDGRTGLEKDGKFTFGHGEFELLIELAERNVQKVGGCGCGCVGDCCGIIILRKVWIWKVLRFMNHELI